jgi:Uma2 family endonuclease
LTWAPRRGDVVEVGAAAQRIGAQRHVQRIFRRATSTAMTDTIMNPPAEPYTWTYSEYARFPDDGNRYEVIDGEVLVTPSPSPNHQHVLGTLHMQMRTYVERFGLGVVLLDVDLLFATGQFLRPDLLFVPAERRDGISDRGVEVAPGLVVEVQSPTSASIDRVKKPRRYGDFGIPEYWVLAPTEGAVWIWHFAQGATEPEHITGSFQWKPEGAAEPLTLETAQLFKPF